MTRPAVLVAALACALAAACERAGGSGPGAPPAVYTSRCAVCHGAAGAGDGVVAAGMRPPPRDFGDPAWQRAVRDDDLRAVIQRGGTARGLSVAMPPHGDLSPADLDALVRFVRSRDRGRDAAPRTEPR